MEKKLQVRGLTISFRTSNGRVHAVRDIDFDLYTTDHRSIMLEDRMSDKGSANGGVIVNAFDPHVRIFSSSIIARKTSESKT